jgi:hypothetical protein
MEDVIEAHAEAMAAEAPEIPAEVLADLADQLGIVWED